jgi:hypothetical protein
MKPPIKPFPVDPDKGSCLIGRAGDAKVQWRAKYFIVNSPDVVHQRQQARRALMEEIQSSRVLAAARRGGSGHTGAQPSSVMNSRRFIQSPRR